MADGKRNEGRSTRNIRTERRDGSDRKLRDLRGATREEPSASPRRLVGRPFIVGVAFALGLGAAAYLLLLPAPAVPSPSAAVAASAHGDAAAALPGVAAGERAVEAAIGDGGAAKKRVALAVEAPGGEGAYDDLEPDSPNPPGAAPDGLKRADVLAAISPLEDRITECYGPEQRGTVKLSVSASGKVLAAVVGGGLAGTPAAECVSRIAGEAAFRSTKADSSVLWQLPIRTSRAE